MGGNDLLVLLFVLLSFMFSLISLFFACLTVSLFFA